MTHAVSVKHTFEAGHRLPQLPGKCQSLHGHSWSVEVFVSGDTLHPELGILANFSDLKRDLRAWIDTNLDHGLMLGTRDELAPLLAPYGKVFAFGEGYFDSDLTWPSVENVAVLLGRVAADVLTKIEHAEGAYVSTVIVSETSTNTATWEAPLELGNLTLTGVLAQGKIEVSRVGR